jgi:hypothetical protein
MRWETRRRGVMRIPGDVATWLRQAFHESELHGIAASGKYDGDGFGKSSGGSRGLGNGCKYHVCFAIDEFLGPRSKAIIVSSTNV